MGQDDGEGASRTGNFPSCFFALLCCYKVKHNDNRDEESELEEFITRGLRKVVLPPKGLNLSQKGGAPLRFLGVIQDQEESEERNYL